MRGEKFDGVGELHILSQTSYLGTTDDSGNEVGKVEEGPVVAAPAARHPAVTVEGLAGGVEGEEAFTSMLPFCWGLP